MKMRLALLALLLVLMAAPVWAQSPETAPRPYEEIAKKITATGLKTCQSHAILTDLCTNVGHRLSGSPGAEKAVDWAVATMKSLGFDNVRREPCMVTHWERGPVEKGAILLPGNPEGEAIRVCALGGSVGTEAGGLTAEILEVKSLDELKAAGDKAKGKIIFFNRPFDRSLYRPDYGGANWQRVTGAIEAAKVGAIGALVRSMTSRLDDIPHTGMMIYDPNVTKVPAAAVSTKGAERLAALLKTNPGLKVRLELSSKSFPDVESFNVLGEIRGSEKPEEVIVIGGHLDSWDKGQGAHDDGAGCVHAIEAIRLLKELGLRPKRTIRAVMFMNEENGLGGGRAYAEVKRPGERHIAGIESDNGGFAPRGFGIGGAPAVYDRLGKFGYLLEPIGADKLVRGGGGADIGPLAAQGVPLMGLNVEVHRYFDYHHTEIDTIDAVNERELELGAISMAILSYVIAEEGLPVPTK